MSLLIGSVMGAAVSAAADRAGAVPDLQREQRLRHEIEDAILDGEPVDLRSADGQRFLGIYTQSATGPARGALVILHGRGFHPDWADVVQPLRVGLTESGWDTLAIQLPVLEKEAKYYDYAGIFDAAGPRIEAAVAMARARSGGKVIVIAHSCGAHMANHWLRTRGRLAMATIDGFVGIGMGATDFGQPMREPFALDKMSVPILDIYAEHDFDAVHRLAPQRAAALQAGGNPHSAQVVVPDAEHYFVDRGEALVGVIADWLDRL